MRCSNLPIVAWGLLYVRGLVGFAGRSRNHQWQFAEKREKRELLAIDGEPVAVNVRFNPRARRMVMRVHPVSGEVTVTAPSRASMAAAIAFARGEVGWIAHQRDQVPPSIIFAPGIVVPFSGTPHRIGHSAAKGPAPVWRDCRRTGSNKVDRPG